MKRFIFLISILIFANASANWTSGGGDPKFVKAIHFPKRQVISDAIKLLRKKVQESPFHKNFKDSFISDLDQMQKLDLFFYIPKLFAVGFNRFPGDYTKLVSNGAMTEYKKGGAIYFSKQAIKYNAETLARVIAQEIPHHIFKGRFQRNETFANTLGTFLITGGEIPTTPYSHLQIIREEFDHELRDEFSKRILEKARKDFLDGQNILKIIYYTTHDLYKNRGSFSDYHVEYGYFQNKKDMMETHPKTAEISTLTKLQSDKIAKCMFATYADGATGITKNFQNKLTKVTVKLLDEFKSKIKAVYYAEDFFLPATKIVTNCGFGVESLDGRIMLYKSINRHEDNQCPLGQTCRDF
ncbi:MAG: hypothetical protein HN509_03480 [Halobacteriovoraceae bacterium]|jgi:hypothetical protein|nr:hypothetical protein [Halobacteriovoraceae bacterium]MBT5093227.1 hypothetical protein [Halobacteriovoraceae bacterium]